MTLIFDTYSTVYEINPPSLCYSAKWEIEREAFFLFILNLVKYKKKCYAIYVFIKLTISTCFSRSIFLIIFLFFKYI